MTTYHWHKQGYAIPYDAFGMCVLRKKLDVPAIYASGVAGNSPLAVSDVRTALPSTGFAINDILNLFRVPAGFLLLGGGIRVTTHGGSSATLDIGFVTGTQTATGVANSNTANDDEWIAVADISAVGNFNFDKSTATDWSVASAPNDLYVTNGSIDVTFEALAQILLIADFWVYGCKVF